MWCKSCVAAMMLALIAGVVIASLGFWNLGEFLDVSQPIVQADAILIMGGEGPRYQRTAHAVELYQAGVAPKVVFSGGTLLGAGIDCTSTEMSVDAAISLGFDPDAVIISGEAQSTLDEAANMAAIAAEQEWQSLVLVTDTFHTRRSLATLQQAMPDIDLKASSPDDPRFVSNRWWSTEDGLVFAINEALKLGFYWKNYGIRPF